MLSEPNRSFYKHLKFSYEAITYIPSCKSAKSRIGVLYTWSLTNPHKKKSVGVRSGDLAGRVMYGDPLPVYLAGNCSIKNMRTVLAKCG